jgi:Flp pilus assembly protein TadD
VETAATKESVETLTKDNLLFAVFGILLGFIAGYLLHEVMAARQPARLTAQGGVPAQMPAAPPTAAAAPGGADAGPSMEQVQELSRYVQANPNDAEAVLQLANMNFGIGQWARAGELYNQYLKLKPESPDVLSDLGVTHREQGRYDQALELFRRAQRLDPNHWQSLYNEIVVLGLDLRKYDEAAEVLRRLRQMQPGNSDVERLAAEVERGRNATS